MDKGTIREIFLRNGFTIKDGQTDLKPYVYAAAHELIALASATPSSKDAADEPAARVDRIISASGLAEVSVFLESALKVGTVFYAAAPTCPACQGNDKNMPCAYPSKGMLGCLRDERLPAAAKSEQSLDWPHAPGRPELDRAPLPASAAGAGSEQADVKSHKAKAERVPHSEHYSNKNHSAAFKCPVCQKVQRRSLNFLGGKSLICDGSKFTTEVKQ